MKVFLSTSFLEALIQSDKKEILKENLFTGITSHIRYFSSAYSLHMLFLSLGSLSLEQKRMVLRNIEDLTDSIFSVSMDEIRSELLLVEGLGLEQVVALNQGMDEFYEFSKLEKPTHPLLKMRNFFGETK